MKWHIFSKGIGLKIPHTILLVCLFNLHAHAAFDGRLIKKTEAPTVKKIAIQSSYEPKPSKILDYQIDEIAPTESRPYITHTHIIRQDYKISILISNPKDFLLQRPTDKTPLILYADGFPLNGLNSEYFSQLRKTDIADTLKLWPDKMWIPFIFKRDTTTTDAWNSLFHLAKWNNHEITFNLSLGWSGMFPLENESNAQDKGKVTVVFYHPAIFWVLCLCYLVFITGFVFLSCYTGIIRDPDTTIVNDPKSKTDTKRKHNTTGPFSLSQTQLAFWTVIVIGGFSYLVILTGLADSMNSSILLLLGISGGTTGVASFIDYYKRKSNDPNNPTMVPKIHRSFLLDILSDGMNVSMQRTQTVLWNIVLGGYFVWFVITNKAMPEFSDTLLVLAGVSSTLYVTSKGTENLPAKA